LRNVERRTGALRAAKYDEDAGFFDGRADLAHFGGVKPYGLGLNGTELKGIGCNQLFNTNRNMKDWTIY
jgi:hypothetical protein